MNSQHIEQDPKALKYLPWLAAIALFMQALDGTILNTALPTIAVELNQSPLKLQSIIVSYTLTVALLIPLSGWLSDKYGTKRIFQLAVVLFTIGSICCAISPNLFTLILSRILQAVGGSMMVPVARLAILYAYPKEQLLKVINFITIPGMIGPLLGPSLGGVLVEALSWHWIFLVNIPFGLFLIWMSRFGIPDFKKPVFKFDKTGLLLFGGGVTFLTLLLELVSTNIVTTELLIGIAVITFVLLIGYVVYAKKKAHPLINLNLFSIRTLRIGIIGNLITRLGIGGMPFLIPLLLQVGYGYTATVAGLMMIPAALSNLIAKSLVVPIVNKLGYRNMLISNTFLLGFLICLFFFVDSESPIEFLLPLLFIHGGISSIQFTAMNTLSLADLDYTNSSDGNSILTITQQLSQTFGISVASLVLGMFKQWESLTNGVDVQAFRYSFLFLGIITILSTFIFIQLRSSDGLAMSGHKD
ncbi:MAG TPA: DHA2 family efflux MFS transporter permease subunit [Faecalibacter sp.]